jgi:hypothetical protein
MIPNKRSPQYVEIGSETLSQWNEKYCDFKAENDSDFVVGDNRYSCPWFVAPFLSPKIINNKINIIFDF